MRRAREPRKQPAVSLQDVTLALKIGVVMCDVDVVVESSARRDFTVSTSSKSFSDKTGNKLDGSLHVLPPPNAANRNVHGSLH